MHVVDWIIVTLLSYLFGSFPTSILAGKLLRGIDIREYGSRNAGASNAFRVLGWKIGLIVAVIDIFKGFVPVAFLSGLNFHWIPAGMDVSLPEILAKLFIGFAAVAGHIFPVFSGFKGGKGVAAGAGVIFALYPLPAAICLAVFGLVLTTSGYASLSSVAASLVLPAAYMGIYFRRSDTPDLYSLIFVLTLSLLVIVKHLPNMKRLNQGRENRFDKVMLFNKRKHK